MNIEIRNGLVFVNDEEFPQPWDMVYLKLFF